MRRRVQNLDMRLDLAIAEATRRARPPFRQCLQWIAKTIDVERYAAIQQRFIGAKHSKYLDLVWYARHKFQKMHRIGVHRGAPPRRILDLGCGPGHLGLIARYGGHEVLGLDQPFEEPHLYTALCGLFGIAKIEHRIQAFQPLPRVGEFDRVTATVTKFDLDPLWGLDAWRFFIDDARSMLRAGGRVYITLTSSKERPAEVFDFLAGAARWSKQRAFLI